VDRDKSLAESLNKEAIQMSSKLTFAALTLISLVFTGSIVAQVDFTKFVIDSSFAENSWPLDVKAADFNGDNENDLIVTAKDLTGDNDRVFWYQNDGDENFTEITIDTTMDHPRQV
jgi:hypothetical protein